jgi:uncharacterized protein YbcV (DUF1398 family)
MEQKVLHDCLRLALDGKMPFPETVKRMAETGVERYRADLVMLEKSHFAANGEVLEEKIALAEPPAVGQSISKEGVKSALIDIQQGRIGYGEFLRRIMSAGVTDYAVYLTGKKAIYNGRQGDFYVENFPAAN